jgi:hypothetical protein
MLGRYPHWRVRIASSVYREVRTNPKLGLILGTGRGTIHNLIYFLKEPELEPRFLKKKRSVSERSD